MSITNNKKICFIICSNNEHYEKECLHYIKHLVIPDGYEIDALAIHDATSITSAYNEAMNASDAKYKVYLHQDTFIVNPNFIQEILSLFQDKTIGMIGLVGSPKLPSHGIMWYGERIGYFQDCNTYISQISKLELTAPDYLEVQAIDGFIMVTQYDLPWREDLFDAWDFYDASQSQEFVRRGYRVVVPCINTPWTIHDCGHLSLNQYLKYREIFVKEYSPFRK